MYLLMIQIANIVLFFMSVRHIHEPFQNKRNLAKEMRKGSEHKSKIQHQEFKLFIYFFVVTGM